MTDLSAAITAAQAAYPSWYTLPTGLYSCPTQQEFTAPMNLDLNGQTIPFPGANIYGLHCGAYSSAILNLRNGTLDGQQLANDAIHVNGISNINIDSTVTIQNFSNNAVSANSLNAGTFNGNSQYNGNGLAMYNSNNLSLNWTSTYDNHYGVVAHPSCSNLSGTVTSHYTGNTNASTWLPRNPNGAGFECFTMANSTLTLNVDHTPAYGVAVATYSTGNTLTITVSNSGNPGLNMDNHCSGNIFPNTSISHVNSVAILIGGAGGSGSDPNAPLGNSNNVFTAVTTNDIAYAALWIKGGDHNTFSTWSATDTGSHYPAPQNCQVLFTGINTFSNRVTQYSSIIDGSQTNPECAYLVYADSYTVANSLTCIRADTGSYSKGFKNDLGTSNIFVYQTPSPPPNFNTPSPLLSYPGHYCAPCFLISDPTTLSMITMGPTEPGRAFTQVPLTGFGLFNGGAFTYSACASDGTIGMPVDAQNGSGVPDYPGGQQCQFIYASGAINTQTVLSTTGVNPGPSDLSDIKTYFDSNGVEHFVANSVYPYPLSASTGWRISTGGILPDFVVFTKVNGVWTVDYKLSINAGQLQASNPSLVSSTSCMTYKTNEYSESFWMMRAVTEFAMLPGTPGKLVCVAYYPSSTNESACMVVDLNTGTLDAAFVIPNITDYNAGSTQSPINFGGRSVCVDPSATSPTDQRFVVFYDIFPNADTNSNGPTYHINNAVISNNVATLTTANSSLTTVTHDFGVGQQININALPSPWTALNNPSFQQGPWRIISVTSNTFSFATSQPDQSSAAVTAGTAKIAYGPPMIEFSYNDTAGTITPVSQVLSIGPNYSGAGTGAFDKYGNLFVVGAHPLLLFQSKPIAMYIKTGANRSYSTTFPYNATTFPSSFGNSPANPDYAFGATQVSIGFYSTIINNPNDSTIYHSATNQIQRNAMSYPITTPTNLFSDPNFTGGLLTWTNNLGFATVGYAVYPGSSTHAVSIANSGFVSAAYFTNNTTCSEQYSVTAGVNMTVTGLARCSSGSSTQCLIGLTWYDAHNNGMYTSYGLQFWCDSNAWYPFRCDVAVPAQNLFATPNSQPANYAALAIQAYFLPNAATLYTTNVSIYPTPGTQQTNIVHKSSTYPVLQTGTHAPGPGPMSIDLARNILYAPQYCGAVQPNNLPQSQFLYCVDLPAMPN